MATVELNIVRSLEAERALLGCLMLYPEQIDQIAPILDVQDFYDANHKEIYNTILSLRGNKDFGYLSVGHALGARLQVIGGISALTGFLDYAAFKFEAQEYARIILEKARARRIVNATQMAVNELSAGASMGEIEHILQDLSEAPKWGFSTSVSRYVDEAMQSFEDSIQGKLKGLPTGYYDLDKVMGGIDKGELIVLAGRPSQGKTALAINLAYNVLRRGRSVFFASLEMSGRSIVQRLAYRLARVDGQKYNLGEFDPEDTEKLNSAGVEIRGLPLEIDEKGGQSIDEIFAKAKQLQPDLVIIDYLQLLAGARTGMSLYEIVTHNSSACKNLAKTLSVPVLLLSQLSRAPETRGKAKLPRLSDLRESGAIEQDGDHVWLLYRPEVYEIDKLKDGTSSENMAELIVAKNRNGPTGKVRLTFLKEFMAFESWRPELPL